MLSRSLYLFGFKVSLKPLHSANALAIFTETHAWVGALFDDLGTPSDATGDSTADAVSKLGGFICAVDGIKSPESTP